MIEKININGVEYHVTPVAEGELPTGVTVKVDGVVYQLGDPVVATAAEPATTSIEGTIEKISVNGAVYDIADVEAVEAEKNRAQQAESDIRASMTFLEGVLGDGSFVVGVANLANVVKAGAVTFEMLDGKLRLSVSVVDDLETANTLKPLSANQGKILKELIDIINGTGEGSTDKKITDAIAALVDSAPENLDTLRELAEWIAKHGTEFAAVVADINNIKNDALLTGSVHVSRYSDNINIGGRSLDGADTMSVDIPAATTVTAGVMSAEDKALLKKMDAEQKKQQTQIDNIKPVIYEGSTINNAPDEEDITSEKDLLKLKDRSYGDGMGYVILRKNKTFVEQVTKVNTIYEIRYNFDLGGEEVEIPENCVLKFNGGCLLNGTVVGQASIVESSTRCFYDCLLQGTWNCTAQAHWFADKSLYSTKDSAINVIDSTKDIQLMLDSCFSNIEFKAGIYYITSALYIKKTVTIDMQGAVKHKMYGNYNANDQQVYIFTDRDIDMLVIQGGKDVCIRGGAFDVSMCKGAYTHNCISVDLTKPDVQIWGLEISTGIFGSFFKMEDALFGGRGFYIKTSSDSSLGSYCTMVRLNSYIACFREGVNVVSNKTWVTDVQIGGFMSYCCTYITAGVGTITIDSSIQTSSIFSEELDNYMPCINIVSNSNVIINGKIWDVGNSPRDHQIAIYISPLVKKVELGGMTALDYLHSALGYRHIEGNTTAIVSKKGLKGGDIASCLNHFEVQGSILRNDLEAIEFRGGTISCKYINIYEQEEDVLSVNAGYPLENIFHFDRRPAIINWKNIPTDDGNGTIELIIDLSECNSIISAQYICLRTLLSNINPLCDVVEIIRNNDTTTNVHIIEMPEPSDVSNSYDLEAFFPSGYEMKIIKFLFKRIRKKEDGNLSSLKLYYVISNTAYSEEKNPNTFMSIGGGKMYGTLEVPEVSSDSVILDSTNNYKLEKHSVVGTKLMKYANLPIQPLHAFNSINVAPWAVEGQMAYSKTYKKPCWKNANVHDASKPLNCWEDALGNPVNTNYYGTSRPTNVKIGFQFFDTILNKPIWWAGTAWVDYNGNEVNDAALKKKGMLSERPNAQELHIPIGYMYMWEKTEPDDITGGQTPTGEVIPMWWDGNDWQDASGNFVASGTIRDDE